MFPDHDPHLDPDLIATVDRQGLHPLPGEARRDFYLRVAIMMEADRRKRTGVHVALRIGVSVALAALGVGWF